MTNEQTPLLDGTEPFPTDDNLTKFRKAVGINVGANSDDLEDARKNARGIYKQIIGLQRWRSRQYYVIDGVFYVVVGAQVVIGAALAGMGALSKDHSQAITILGVVNSSLAGILALLKGQGLPDRLRKDEFEMRKVQDFIEETETRLVYMPHGTFTDQQLDELLQTVFAKYNAARDTAEMNRPSSYAHQGEAQVQRRLTAGSGNMGVAKFMSPAPNGKGKGKNDKAAEVKDIDDDEEQVHYEIS